VRIKKSIIPIIFVLVLLLCTISLVLGPDFWNNVKDRANWSEKRIYLMLSIFQKLHLMRVIIPLTSYL